MKLPKVWPSTPILPSPSVSPAARKALVSAEVRTLALEEKFFRNSLEFNRVEWCAWVWFSEMTLACWYFWFSNLNPCQKKKKGNVMLILNFWWSPPRFKERQSTAFCFKNNSKVLLGHQECSKVYAAQRNTSAEQYLLKLFFLDETALVLIKDSKNLLYLIRGFAG